MGGSPASEMGKGLSWVHIPPGQARPSQSPPGNQSWAAPSLRHSRRAPAVSPAPPALSQMRPPLPHLLTRLLGAPPLSSSVSSSEVWSPPEGMFREARTTCSDLNVSAPTNVMLRSLS